MKAIWYGGNDRYNNKDMCYVILIVFRNLKCAVEISVYIVSSTCISVLILDLGVWILLNL